MVTSKAFSDFYLKKLLDFLNNQLLDFLRKHFRASLHELVVDILQALHARLLLALRDLTEETGCCSKGVVLRIMLVSEAWESAQAMLTFDNACNDKLTCVTSEASEALSS